MRRVTAAALQADRDVVGYRSDGHLRVDAAMYHRASEELRWFVLVDGKLVATGLSSGSGPSFGKEAERQHHEPWGPFASEYTFSHLACPDCAPGTESIAFSSTLHDADHASGVLTIDDARAVVLHERRVPYAFGTAGTTGTIDVDYGATELGWRAKTLHGDFHGNVGPFGGTARIDTIFDGYRRFPTVESAIAALSS